MTALASHCTAHSARKARQGTARRARQARKVSITFWRCEGSSDSTPARWAEAVSTTGETDEGVVFCEAMLGAGIDGGE
ncbi:hypothetical protein FRC12_025176 [Ceratobasidium sp. 428]|nr:hypothetical protein FRC12_025176 [Ceratobasidium sp. 428]